MSNLGNSLPREAGYFPIGSCAKKLRRGAERRGEKRGNSPKQWAHCFHCTYNLQHDAIQYKLAKTLEPTKKTHLSLFDRVQ